MRERVVEVRATVAVDGSDPQLWTAQVPCTDRCFGGLFSWGNSFDDARERLAGLVLVAVEGGAAGNQGIQVDSVRVFSTTRKTFPAAALKNRVR